MKYILWGLGLMIGFLICVGVYNDYQDFKNDIEDKKD